jgi:UDP-N-acetylmuramoyl-tripeptide--D-alanyl-D-alanine ligase
MLTLTDVIEALSGMHLEQVGRVITETVIDSRQAIPGCMFVALPGQRVDGHDFVGQAIERGAHVALVQRDFSDSYAVLNLRKGHGELDINTATVGSDAPLCLWVDDSLAALQTVARFWRRKLNLRVIGITGSVGKSTTKELVAEVLDQRYRTLKSSGNLNNEIGLPLTLLSLSEGHERAVLEMGFYVPGEIAFLCDLALPQIGVVTNIGTVHAERAGSQEEIARGKAELVQALPPAPDGVAILNFDDPLVRRMAELTQARVFFYGLDPHADLWADGVEGLGLEGIRFRLHYQHEVLHLRVPLIGRHSVHAALRATAVGLIEGLTWQEIFSGLRSEHAQLRLVAVRTESGALILDDTYNASPESTLAALNLLDEIDEDIVPPRRKVAVLGDMLELGPYERSGHEMVGARVAEVADELIAVGERARMIAAAAYRAGLPEQAITELEDASQAIELLKGRLGPNDIVLIKGSRGMYMERIVAGLEWHP